MKLPLEAILGLFLTTNVYAAEAPKSVSETAEISIVPYSEIAERIYSIPDQAMEAMEPGIPGIYLTSRMTEARRGESKIEKALRLEKAGFSREDSEIMAELSTTPGNIVVKQSFDKSTLFHELYHRECDRLDETAKSLISPPTGIIGFWREEYFAARAEDRFNNSKKADEFEEFLKKENPEAYQLHLLLIERAKAAIRQRKDYLVSEHSMQTAASAQIQHRW